MKKIFDILFSSSYTIKERIFLLGGAIGIISMFAAFLLASSAGDGITAGIGPLIGTFILAFITYFCFKEKKIELGSAFIVIISSCLVIPYGFFKGGGINSGSASWFIMGLVVVFMFYRGKKFFIYFTIAAIAMIFSLSSELYPE